jgi:hypothetical protein
MSSFILSIVFHRECPCVDGFVVGFIGGTLQTTLWDKRFAVNQWLGIA